MKVSSSLIPEVMIIEPQVFGDHRGFFFESFNQRNFEMQTGISCQFVQDNHSSSKQHTLRGLHYQIRQPQGKLVRVVTGTVFDVSVDIRKDSPTLGQWVGVYLSAENKKQLWIPPGFAHGFLVISEVAELLYKTTDYYSAEYERAIRWNDSDLKIDWPLEGIDPILSPKDSAAPAFKAAELWVKE